MLVSDISVIEKSNKALMVKSNDPGSVDLFAKKTGGLFMYSALFPDLQKMALCCSHGLVTFDLKIRCEVQCLWHRVAVGSVDHPYMMYGCFYIQL